MEPEADAARRADAGHGPRGRRPHHAQLIKKVAANRTVLMVEHNMSVVAEHRRHDHRAAARRDAGRRPVRRGVEEPGGDRGLHGQRRRRAAGSALMMAQRFLEINDLHGWYGESHVLHGVDFDVDEGEVVTPARPQRRRPHQHAARDPGPDRQRARARSRSTAPRPSAWRRTASPASASATAPRSAASSRACRPRRT